VTETTGSPQVQKGYSTPPEEARVVVGGENGATDAATASYDDSSSTADVDYHPAWISTAVDSSIDSPL
jgi:hypothetical protein